MSNWLSAPDDVSAMTDAQLSALHLGIQTDLRILRYAIPLVILVIMAGYVLHMRSMVNAVTSEQFGEAFEKRSKYLLPKVQDAFMEVGEEVAPSVGESLANEVDDLMANFSGKLNSELEGMKATLPKQMEGLLLRQMKDARERQIKVLNQQFPELKNDPKKIQALMESFEMAFSRWAQKMLVAHFNRHLRDLENIKRTLNGFVAKQNQAIKKSADTARKAGAGVKAAGTRVNPEQLLGLWLEIMEESIKGEGPVDLLDDTKKGKK